MANVFPSSSFPIPPPRPPSAGASSDTATITSSTGQPRPARPRKSSRRGPRLSTLVGDSLTTAFTSIGSDKLRAVPPPSRTRSETSSNSGFETDASNSNSPLSANSPRPQDDDEFAGAIYSPMTVQHDWVEAGTTPPMASTSRYSSAVHVSVQPTIPEFAPPPAPSLPVSSPSPTDELRELAQIKRKRVSKVGSVDQWASRGSRASWASAFSTSSTEGESIYESASEGDGDGDDEGDVTVQGISPLVNKRHSHRSLREKTSGSSLSKRAKGAHAVEKGTSAPSSPARGACAKPPAGVAIVTPDEATMPSPAAQLSSTQPPAHRVSQYDVASDLDAEVERLLHESERQTPPSSNHNLTSYSMSDTSAHAKRVSYPLVSSSPPSSPTKSTVIPLRRYSAASAAREVTPIGLRRNSTQSQASLGSNGSRSSWQLKPLVLTPARTLYTPITSSPTSAADSRRSQSAMGNYRPLSPTSYGSGSGRPLSPFGSSPFSQAQSGVARRRSLGYMDGSSSALTAVRRRDSASSASASAYGYRYNRQRSGSEDTGFTRGSRSSSVSAGSRGDEEKHSGEGSPQEGGWDEDKLANRPIHHLGVVREGRQVTSWDEVPDAVEGVESRSRSGSDDEHNVVDEIRRGSVRSMDDKEEPTASWISAPLRPIIELSLPTPPPATRHRIITSYGGNEEYDVDELGSASPIGIPSPPPTFPLPVLPLNVKPRLSPKTKNDLVKVDDTGAHEILAELSSPTLRQARLPSDSSCSAADEWYSNPATPHVVEVSPTFSETFNLRRDDTKASAPPSRATHSEAVPPIAQDSTRASSALTSAPNSTSSRQREPSPSGISRSSAPSPAPISIKIPPALQGQPIQIKSRVTDRARPAGSGRAPARMESTGRNLARSGGPTADAVDGASQASLVHGASPPTRSAVIEIPARRASVASHRHSSIGSAGERRESSRTSSSGLTSRLEARDPRTRIDSPDPIMRMLLSSSPPAAVAPIKRVSYDEDVYHKERLRAESMSAATPSSSSKKSGGRFAQRLLCSFKTSPKMENGYIHRNEQNEYRRPSAPAAYHTSRPLSEASSGSSRSYEHRMPAITPSSPLNLIETGAAGNRNSDVELLNNRSSMSSGESDRRGPPKPYSLPPGLGVSYGGLPAGLASRSGSLNDYHLPTQAAYRSRTEGGPYSGQGAGDSTMQRGNTSPGSSSVASDTSVEGQQRAFTLNGSKTGSSAQLVDPRSTSQQKKPLCSYPLDCVVMQFLLDGLLGLFCKEHGNLASSSLVALKEDVFNALSAAFNLTSHVLASSSNTTLATVQSAITTVSTTAQQTVDASPFLTAFVSHPAVIAAAQGAAPVFPHIVKTAPTLVFIYFLQGRKERREKEQAMAELNKAQAPFGQVEVHWGRERLIVALPPPASPVSALKATLFNLTGVPPNHQKLVISGAILRDDLAPLSSVGLIDAPPETTSSSFWSNWSLTGNSGKNKKLKKLVLIGDKDLAKVLDRKVPIQEPKVDKAPDTEATIVKKIGELVGNSLEEWEPKIVGLEQYMAQQKGTAPAPAEGEAAAEPVEAPNPRTAIWLSEVLLQSLLKLDSFDIPSEFTEARKVRKAAVKTLQGALDRVDTYISAKL